MSQRGQVPYRPRGGGGRGDGGRGGAGRGDGGYRGDRGSGGTSGLTPEKQVQLVRCSKNLLTRHDIALSSRLLAILVAKSKDLRTISSDNSMAPEPAKGNWPFGRLMAQWENP